MCGIQKDRPIMSVLIQTKYLSPTNKRGPRVKAFFPGFSASATVPYHADLDAEANHMVAVKALCEKSKITVTQWVHGYVPRGFVHISTDKPE